MRVLDLQAQIKRGGLGRFMKRCTARGRTNTEMSISWPLFLFLSFFFFDTGTILIKPLCKSRKGPCQHLPLKCQKLNIIFLPLLPKEICKSFNTFWVLQVYSWNRLQQDPAEKDNPQMPLTLLSAGNGEFITFTRDSCLGDVTTVIA